MKQSGVLCVLFFVVLSAYCASGSGALYERNKKDSEVASTLSGDVVFSRAEFDPQADASIQKKYYLWRFKSADKTNLNFSYEEHYGKIKDQPDLQDNRAVPYKNGEAMIGQTKVILYSVKPNAIIYRVEQAP